METILWTVLVLGVLVFVHELGHFVAAKASGIQVPRFSIGLGPRLVGFRIGETDYCLSAVPFGGYVKMAGMEGEEAVAGLEGDPLLRGAAAEDLEDGREADKAAKGRAGRAEGGRSSAKRGPRSAPAFEPSRGFDSKPLAVRLLVILAGVFMNFLFGFVVFVFVSYHEGSQIVPPIVAEVAPELVDRDPGLEGWRGRRVEAVNGEPVETWDHLFERLTAQPPDAPVRVRFADGREDELDPAVTAQELAEGLSVGLTPVIGEIQAGTAAAEAGLREGDRVLALDGKPVVMWGDLQDYVRGRAGRRVMVRVERDERPGSPGGERQLEIPVVPRSESSPGADNKFVQVGQFGVKPLIETEPITFVQALRQGTRLTLEASSLILGGLGQLVTGRISFKSLGGPVAIGQITGYYQRQGFDHLLWWMALFSINLAILNLLPIPVLDGGHVMFLAIEGLRGYPLSARSKIRLSQVGMVMLLLLMAWAVTSDVLRLIGL